MLAYKTKINIDTNFLQLMLPYTFKGKQVEVIVLEIDSQVEEKKDLAKKQKNEPNEFQNFLLTAPTWSDKEYNNYLENKKIFNSWKIE